MAFARGGPQKRKARTLGTSQQYVSQVGRGLHPKHWARQVGVAIWRLAQDDKAGADAILVELMAIAEEAVASSLSSEELERLIQVGIEREAAAEAIEDAETRRYLRSGDTGQAKDAYLAEARELVRLVGYMACLERRRRVH